MFKYLQLLPVYVVFAISISIAQTSHGHALEPGYLEITKVGNNNYKVVWKVPQVNGAPMAITPVLPDICQQRSPSLLEKEATAFVSSWLTSCSEAIEGKRLNINGLQRTSTDVLVRVVNDSGRSSTLLLTPDKTAQYIPTPDTRLDVGKTYFSLGVEHILIGADHLMFVLALLFLAQGVRRLIATVTAFTLAHSITLSMASLGVISVHIPPIEAIIALSIIFLAIELTKKDQHNLAEKSPWLIAFIFGLLHGLGFASALGEIGLPQHEIPVALLAFNIGVEAGQLLFIGAVLGVTLLLKSCINNRRQSQLYKTWATNTSIYVMGGVASYWLIDRIAAF
ncbi:HupE/UreJ family protein [Parendozoicomonas sp. Alg238-R29]|uniref:HupE/UreJ family protein n=1 Tax=Parendozoicomonas sp. Alg238-R29 TaxID=2993446 RepID=UPI00248EB8A4|nr:HupE/UreJ family protein [Parendozoicomonas sp. Alg238-R29]